MNYSEKEEKTKDEDSKEESMDKLIQKIDNDLNLDLFLQNKNFAFNFDKNNEIDCEELVKFFNEHFFGDESLKITQKVLVDAVSSGKFVNLKGHVLDDSRIIIEELRGLGYDWIVAETKSEKENLIIESLKGKKLRNFKIIRRIQRKWNY
jgi:hypothetical protein